MSLSSFVPLITPMIQLIASIAGNALREPDPKRYVRRRLEAEATHRAFQEAAKAALEKGKT